MARQFAEGEANEAAISAAKNPLNKSVTPAKAGV